MVFKHFALLLAGRVTLLALSLFCLALSLVTAGYYALNLVLALLCSFQVYELYRYLARTNLALSRFLNALHNQDFNQTFNTPLGSGADFERLSQSFSQIVNDFRHTREIQEKQLNRYKALTEHIPVPLISLKADQQIQLHNRAARRLFAGNKVSQLSDITPYGVDFAEQLAHLQVGQIQAEKRRLLNFNDQEQEKQLAVMASQVITGDQSETLISLQDIRAELDQVQLQAWQDLVRVLTHEIMNSITPVASLAQTAEMLATELQSKLAAPETAQRNEQNDHQLNSDQQDDLCDLKQAVTTLAKRADSLLQFVQNYRSLTELPKPKRQPIQVAQLFNQVSTLILTSASASATEQQTQINLTTDIVPEQLELNADADLVEQMLINLIKNAQQAVAAQGQIKLTARINKNGHVIITVEDNGSGIDEQMTGKIFIPFFTTKAKGSGVGLALSRQVMIAHGGNIRVSKSELGGAKFSLFFS